MATPAHQEQRANPLAGILVPITVGVVLGAPLGCGLVWALLLYGPDPRKPRRRR